MSISSNLLLHLPPDIHYNKRASTQHHSRNGSLIAIFGPESELMSSKSIPKNLSLEKTYNKRMTVSDSQQSYFEVGGRSSINFGVERVLNSQIKSKKFPNYTSKLGPARNRQTVKAKSLMLKDDSLYLMMKIHDNQLPLKSQTLKIALTLKTKVKPGLKQGQQGKNVSIGLLSNMNSQGKIEGSSNFNETTDNPISNLNEVLANRKNLKNSRKNISSSSHFVNSPATFFSKDIASITSLLDYKKVIKRPESSKIIGKSFHESHLTGNERKHLDLFFSNKWIVKFIRTKYADDEYFNKEIDKEVKASRKFVDENIKIRENYQKFFDDSSLPPTQRQYIFNDENQTPEEFISSKIGITKNKDHEILKEHLHTQAKKDGQLIKERRKFLNSLRPKEKRLLMISQLKKYCKLLVQCDVPLEEVNLIELFLVRELSLD